MVQNSYFDICCEDPSIGTGPKIVIRLLGSIMEHTLYTSGTIGRSDLSYVHLTTVPVLHDHRVQRPDRTFFVSNALNGQTAKLCRSLGRGSGGR